MSQYPIYTTLYIYFQYISMALKNLQLVRFMLCYKRSIQTKDIHAYIHTYTLTDIGAHTYIHTQTCADIFRHIHEHKPQTHRQKLLLYRLFTTILNGRRGRDGKWSRKDHQLLRSSSWFLLNCRSRTSGIQRKSNTSSFP